MKWVVSRSESIYVCLHCFQHCIDIDCRHKFVNRASYQFNVKFCSDVDIDSQYLFCNDQFFSNVKFCSNIKFCSNFDVDSHGNQR